MVHLGFWIPFLSQRDLPKAGQACAISSVISGAPGPLRETINASPCGYDSGADFAGRWLIAEQRGLDSPPADPTRLVMRAPHHLQRKRQLSESHVECHRGG